MGDADFMSQDLQRRTHTLQRDASAAHRGKHHPFSETYEGDCELAAPVRNDVTIACASHGVAAVRSPDVALGPGGERRGDPARAASAYVYRGVVKRMSESVEGFLTGVVIVASPEVASSVRQRYTTGATAPAITAGAQSAIRLRPIARSPLAGTATAPVPAFCDKG